MITPDGRRLIATRESAWLRRWVWSPHRWPGTSATSSGTAPPESGDRHRDVARLGGADDVHRHVGMAVLSAACCCGPGALLMIVTGLVYATSTTFLVLLVVGVIGTMNPRGGDVNVVQPIEQSLLPLTTADEHRSSAFARYSFFGGSLAALGALSAGLPARLHWQASSAFVIYACSGLAMLVVYAAVSPQVEAKAQATTPTPLGPSKRIVYKLAALFTLDSFGGGFVVQSLLVLWLLRAHDFSVGKAGVVLADHADPLGSVGLRRRANRAPHRPVANDGVHPPPRSDPVDRRGIHAQRAVGGRLPDRSQPGVEHGRADSQRLRDVGGHPAGACRGGERDQRAAQPGIGTATACRRMDARPFDVRLALDHRRIVEDRLRPVAVADGSTVADGS